MAAPVYRGHFGKPQAERLLWRAGFGPRPGEAERLARMGLHGAVHHLTHPGRERLKGPRPHDDNGRALAPNDAWGHDQLWWLDRMVRTRRPLIERMTLVWHDWFATSREGVGPARLMLRQNRLFRTHALGSFATLLREVTCDPAMLLWLNGTDNTRDDPNENYAREMMELFTLGADRGAYTEHDVREQARALTGWDNDWSDNLGPVNFHFDKKRHDTGTKRDLRQARPLRLEGLLPPLRPPSQAPVVLRHQALELLHPDGAAGRDQERARAPLRPPRLPGAAGRRGDPPAPRALQRAADGEVAGRLPGRAPPLDAARDRHRVVDVAAQPRRPAALLPAERRRLGRHALARHRHLPRALDDRELRDAAAHARQRQGQASAQRDEARPPRRDVPRAPGDHGAARTAT